jgi:acyl-ACP thioesterase
VSELPAVDLLPVPDRGRTFSAERTVRLGDVDRRGHLRLDAVARYLQDVATDDAIDAGLDNAMGWVVRRTMITVSAPAALNEHVRLTTFCTGSGRSWAERRTTVNGTQGAIIDGVSLWIQIDVDSGRPTRLGDDFHRIYGEAANGRTVSSKLSLPKAPPGAMEGSVSTHSWSYRSTDVDPFGHVNNAAQWSLVEDLLDRTATERVGTGELEFLGPSDTGGSVVTAGDTIWFRDDGRVSTVCRWSPAAGSAQAQPSLSGIGIS